MNAKHKRAIERRIQEAEDALSWAQEALEKGDVNEVENQLDLAAQWSGEALSISEHLNDDEATPPDPGERR